MTKGIYADCCLYHSLGLTTVLGGAIALMCGSGKVGVNSAGSVASICALSPLKPQWALLLHLKSTSEFLGGKKLLVVSRNGHLEAC